MRKIGQIGVTGESLLLRDELINPTWMVHPDWAEREGIQSIAGHPLMFRGENLGVLGVFSREPMSEQQFRWLRVFADQAAVSIANARAFEELEALRVRLELENEYLRSEVKENFGGLIGQSAALQQILQQIELVAPTDASVLILGESGTGKELIARAIHDRSKRSAQALVKVNCALVPRELFESEFFGHVKGAFTGAVRDRVGRFQLADGGTLFLDEVGEIPLALQSKLLRVLQEGEFERVGEDRTRRVNVRMIAATNRQLEQEVAANRFRQDLYFRLSVFPLEVQPLRERREDIPMLAAHFVARIAARLHLPTPRLSEANVAELCRYAWPGNIRELQNVIERAVILSQEKTATLRSPRSCWCRRGRPVGGISCAFDTQTAARIGTAEHSRSAPEEWGQDLWPRWRGRAARHAPNDALFEDCRLRDQAALKRELHGLWAHSSRRALSTCEAAVGGDIFVV
jgi:transcriptional regulator with GAF, ATPase, and Fis domain